MKTEYKDFDAVAFQRQIREQITKETEGMNFNEQEKHVLNNIAQLRMRIQKIKITSAAQ